MADDARIEELRRRVQKDPASIAFAQLGEELRRAKRLLEAVEVCRAGLDLYPGYPSARVTLGRCYLDLGRLDEAQRELERVHDSAPENLAAIRALAELHQRRTVEGESSEGRIPEGRMSDIRLPSTGLRPGKPDATYEGTVRLKPDTTYDDANGEQMSDIRLPSSGLTPGEPDATYEGLDGCATDERTVRTLAALESLLDAIHVTRASRSA